MKKAILFLMISFTLGLVVKAQDDKDKVKQTSTVPQKMHNAVSKHKRHNGWKSKSEHNGVTHKHKTNTATGETEDKITK